MGFLRVALFLLAVIALFGFGSWMAGKLRGAREPNTLRYKGLFFGFALLALVSAMAFCTFRVLELPGWKGNGPWILTAFMVFCAVFMALIVLGTRITVAGDELVIRQLIPPTTRRIALASIQSYEFQPQFGRLQIKYETASSVNKYAFLLYFLEGNQVLLDYISTISGPRASSPRM